MDLDYETRAAEREREYTERLRELEARGFKLAWVRDIRVGDIVTKVPDGVMTSTVPLMVVEQIFRVDGSYHDYDEDEYVTNRVIHWMGLCEDGVTREFTYGHSHNIHIFR